MSTETARTVAILPRMISGDLSTSASAPLTGLIGYRVAHVPILQRETNASVSDQMQERRSGIRDFHYVHASDVIWLDDRPRQRTQIFGLAKGMHRRLPALTCRAGG